MEKGTAQMINPEQFTKIQDCETAFYIFQQALTKYKSFPTEKNRLAALDKHRIWQDIFLNLPPSYMENYGEYEDTVRAANT